MCGYKYGSQRSILAHPDDMVGFDGQCFSRHSWVHWRACMFRFTVECGNDSDCRLARPPIQITCMKHLRSLIPRPLPASQHFTKKKKAWNVEKLGAAWGLGQHLYIAFWMGTAGREFYACCIFGRLRQRGFCTHTWWQWPILPCMHVYMIASYNVKHQFSISTVRCQWLYVLCTSCI